MHTIAQSQILLRTRTAMPDGLKVATEEFREGWDFVRSANALRMGKQIMARGWNFVSVADGSLRSGVGDTSQEAIGSALKLALRHISVHFNAVEVEHIELTQYPWFFLARVRVLPYLIQQGAALPVAEEVEAIPALRRQRRPSIDAGLLYPHPGGAMPQLKQLLISSRTAQDGAL
jgi:hypothetical protein